MIESFEDHVQCEFIEFGSRIRVVIIVRGYVDRGD